MDGVRNFKGNPMVAMMGSSSSWVIVGSKVLMKTNEPQPTSEILDCVEAASSSGSIPVGSSKSRKYPYNCHAAHLHQI
jgi:hypothetical protein